MIVGPRAVAKTTTARRLARREVRLDVAVEARAFEADPDAALHLLDEPAVIDEWQAVPGVLGAIKRAVDNYSRPGRYIITGSVRADLSAPTWPGTVRLIRVDMCGLTVGEQLGRVPRVAFLDRVRDGGIDAALVKTEHYNLYDYIELAVTGGFPEPVLHLAPENQRIWLNSYIDQLVTRDAAELEEGRDPAGLRRYLETIAAHTAGVVEHKAIYDAAGLNRKTGVAYERLLRNLLVIDSVPAWSESRIKRLTKAPKRYLTDVSLAARLLRVDAVGVMRNGDLIGRVLDTFVMAQIRAELPRCKSEPRVHHLRQEDGRHEVDLLAEVDSDRVVGIEVKAGAPTAADARHLMWLRDALGDRFIAGLILHTGPLPYVINDRIAAVPISVLWTE